MSKPLIMYDNRIPDAYAVLKGVEQSGALFSEAQTWDCLRVWLVTTDAAGTMQVRLDYLAPQSATHLILGAHQHDAAGHRFAGGSVQLQIWDGVALADTLATTAITAAQSDPSMHALTPQAQVLLNGYYSYWLTLTGLPPLTDITIPEIFIGPALTMPWISYSFDPRLEEWTGPKIKTETGRIYEDALSRRYISTPVFQYIDLADAALIDIFRETHIEERIPFWWFWNPTDFPLDGFMMRHNATTLPLNYTNSNLRTCTLNMIEAV